MKINIKIEGLSTIDYTFQYDKDISELDLLKIIVNATEKVGERSIVQQIKDINIKPIVSIEDVKNRFNKGSRKYNTRLSKEEWNRILSELDGGRTTFEELEKQGFNKGTLYVKLCNYKRNNFSVK